MHFTNSVLVPFSLLVTAVLAIPTPAPAGDAAPATKNGRSTLTFTMCEYRKGFSQECGALVTYTTPSGTQTINLGVSRHLCGWAARENQSNKEGFTIGGASWWDRATKSAVKVSYKGQSFQAERPRRSLMMDWEKLDSICTPAFPKQDSKMLRVGDFRPSGRTTRKTGSSQEIYPDVPDILAPKST